MRRQPDERNPVLRRKSFIELVVPDIHLMPDARCHHCADARCTLPAAIAVLYDGPCRGLGDRVAAVASITGIAAVARTVERVTGKPCGCAARRAALNAALPTNNA